MASRTLDPVQAAIILPELITMRLDHLVRLGVGESRESLVNEALDEFLVVTEQRLERKKRTLALQRIQPGTEEWAASFQKLEQVAATTQVLSDEEMDDLITEAVSETRKERQTP